MAFRIILFFAVALIAAILYLWFYPLGNRSAHSDIKGGDDRVIGLSRPHYIFPREYFGEGGMNPIDFWSHTPDPDFGANKISMHEFLDLEGEIQTAAVQGFNINRTFTNPNHREEIMAIRVGTEIFEFQTPNFQYVVGAGSSSKFYFLGQHDNDLIYYIPFAVDNHDFVLENGKYVEGVVRITLPFDAATAKITTSDDARNWDAIVRFIRSIEPTLSVHKDLCERGIKESHEFAESLFERDC